MKMQTTLFYVKLNERLLKAIENKTFKGKPSQAEWAKAGKTILTIGKKYPVLAVHYIELSDDKNTVIQKTQIQGVNINIKQPEITDVMALYHIPIDKDLLLWVPSNIFLFAGLE